MQAVTKNPDDAHVVAKVLRRNSSLNGTGDYFIREKKTTKTTIYLCFSSRGFGIGIFNNTRRC
jgi:hypothetical protein